MDWFAPRSRCRKPPFLPWILSVGPEYVQPFVGGPVTMSLALHRLCKPRLLVFLKSLLGLTALVLGFSFCLTATHAWPRTRPTTRPRRRAEEGRGERDSAAGRNRSDDRRRSGDEGHLLPRHQGPGERSRDSFARVQQRQGQPEGLLPGAGVGPLLAGEARLRRHRARPPRLRRQPQDQDQRQSHRRSQGQKGATGETRGEDDARPPGREGLPLEEE